MTKIRTWFNDCRKTYNLALNAVKCGKFKPLDEGGLKKRFVAKMQRGKRLAYLTETPSKLRAGAIKELCVAYKTNFDIMKTNYTHKFDLKFRSRKDIQSISLQKDSFVKLKSKFKDRLFFPQYITDKIGYSPRDIDFTKINHDCRLILSRTGKLFVSIPVSYTTPKMMSETDNIMAIDPGVRTAYTCFAPNSETPFLEYGKGDITKVYKLGLYLDKLMGKITKEKNKRKKKSLRKAVNRLRERIANLKADSHHRICHDILKNADTILIPDFKTSQMIKKGERKIRKVTVRKMLNWSHYSLRQKLITKAKELGKKVIVVTEEYTSKTCCKCGNVDSKLGGSKIYNCKVASCRFQIDRDYNGAINILLKHLTERCVPSAA